ncbi:MAG: aminotransferase class V-fold PLP-dependent enzyme [Bacteroidota bacterium]
MKFSPQEIDRFRAETPGTAQRNHLNNAGAALPPNCVTDAVIEYLQTEAVVGGYELKAQRATAIEGFYEATADLLHTKARNIAYTSSATDSFARVLGSIPFQKGDVIITTDDDYVSNQLAFLSLQNRFGIRLLRCPVLPSGGFDPEAMTQMILKERPKLVAITHVPTNSGLIQDVESIGAVCRQEGIWYLVDACQSVGQMDVDVNKIGCDFLSATGRKFLRGPRGTGFLYASDRALNSKLEPLFFDLRGATWEAQDAYTVAESAKKYEYWELPYALLIGFSEALQYISRIGINRIHQRVQMLHEYTRSKLLEVPNLRMMDRGSQLCSIVTCHIDGQKPEHIQKFLFQNGINTSYTNIGSAIIDFERKQIDWVLRISPHYYNTVTEIDQCVEVLKQL